MDHFIALVANCNLDILVWVATRKGFINRALLSTEGALEEFGTFPAEDFLTVETGYPLSSSVPGDYSPVLVQCHDTFGDAVEN